MAASISVIDFRSMAVFISVASLVSISEVASQDLLGEGVVAASGVAGFQRLQDLQLFTLRRRHQSVRQLDGERLPRSGPDGRLLRLHICSTPDALPPGAFSGSRAATCHSFCNCMTAE